MNIIYSIFESLQMFGWLGRWSTSHRRFGQAAVLGVILAGMSIQGYANVHQQRRIQGEYSNPTMEQLIEWINNNTPKSKPPTYISCVC